MTLLRVFNFNYFMDRFKRPSESSSRTFSPQALKLLYDYPWPGNIRELKNFSERVNIMSEERVVSADTVRRTLGASEAQAEQRDDLFAAFAAMKLTEARDAFEREFLVRKLAESGNNITQTSRVLGVTPSALHNKIRKYAIDLKR